MKFTELWKSDLKPTISFEFFPPRSEKGAENLEKAITKLAKLNPDFVSVTFGAGGSTREGSRQLIEKLIQEKGLNVLAYFAGYGLGSDDILSVIDSYCDLGVDNILVVRGDEPREIEDFKPHPKSFSHASDLMEFLRPKYPCCLGVAGYPEGHIEAESKEKDIDYLKLKVDKGAEFIIANYFYDNQFFYDFMDRCQAAGIQVPIIPGVMPIFSVKMMTMLAGLCGATIVDEIHQALSKIDENDKESLNQFGIDYAFQQSCGLLDYGVPGLHFYTMDRSKSVLGIVERLRTDGHL
jgi:methylenetetrahydrofolate reductase (NADPH)